MLPPWGPFFSAVDDEPPLASRRAKPGYPAPGPRRTSIILRQVVAVG